MSDSMMSDAEIRTLAKGYTWRYEAVHDFVRQWEQLYSHTSVVMALDLAASSGILHSPRIIAQALGEDQREGLRKAGLA